ncbi:MAG: hypothetical protein AB8B64_23275 [Granulosicoccus sp.]
MKTPKASVDTVRTLLFALACCAGSNGLVYAEDVVPSKDQSDDQINVWVDNAPLELFISQLALITDRDVSIDGELSGQVSGRFNGSMIDTLGAVGKQFPVLFDLDDGVLGAVADSNRSSATIALGDIALGDEMEAALLDDVLPGNELQIRPAEVIISGHPAYVGRVAKVLLSAVARSDTKAIAAISTTTAASVVEENAAVADPKVSEPVVGKATIGKAAQMILDEAAQEVEDAKPADTTTASVVAETTTTEIRWVTDIPGYETF